MRTSPTVQCTGRPVEIQKCGKSPCPGVFRVHRSGVFLNAQPTLSALSHLCLLFSTAKCQRVCIEGHPSEDCSRCVCEGHVLHGEVQSVTGVPVAGAWVALASQPKVIRARTDAKGQFLLKGVCSSSSTLISIRKEKFSPITVSTFGNTTGLSWVQAVLKSAGEYR